MKNPMIILNTSSLTLLSTEDVKYPIMVMIQTDYIKHYVKKGIRTATEHDKNICTDVGKVFPIHPNINRRRPRIHHTRTDIWLLVVIPKSKNVHIRDILHIKWIIFLSNVHEDYILPKTRDRWTNRIILYIVWGIHIHSWTGEIHSHNTHITKYNIFGRKLRQWY